MRIAYFTDTFYPKIDGVVTSILNSSKKLIEDKHEILIIAPRYKGMHRELHWPGVTVKRCFSLSLISYPDVKIAIPNFVESYFLIKRWKPDIIHIHTPLLIGYMGTLFSRMFNIPLIGTFHALLTKEEIAYFSPKRLLKLDRLISTFTSKTKFRLTDKIALFRFLKELSEKTKEKRMDRWEKGYAKRIIWRLIAIIYNKCDKIIVPSNQIKKVIKPHVKKEVEVISNGIELKLFRPKSKYKKGTFNLIHVGRVGYEKNVDVVIKSVDIIRKVYPKVKLDVIGPGPALPNLKRLVKKLSLNRNVRFLGKIDYKKLNCFYKKADIFLTASTMETQGLVILEAMASGLPIIGVKKYAIPDLVINDKNGYIVKPFNHRAMAEKTIALLSNPNLIEKFGKESARMVKRHDINITYKRLEELYEKLLK